MNLQEAVQILNRHNEYWKSRISPDDCDYEQSLEYLSEIRHNRKNVHELRRILSRLEHRMDIEYIVMVSATYLGEIALDHLGFDASEITAYDNLFDDGFDIYDDDLDLGL